MDDTELFDPESGSTTSSLASDPAAGPSKALNSSTGASASGSLLSGIGSLLQAKAELDQAHAARQRARTAAFYSNRAAADAVYRGMVREYDLTARGSKIIAAQRVMSSHGNLDVNVGAQQQTEASSRANLEFDRALVRRNAAMEAYGLRARAQQQEQQGADEEAAGEARALGTFLSGIANVAQSIGSMGVG